MNEQALVLAALDKGPAATRRPAPAVCRSLRTTSARTRRRAGSTWRRRTPPSWADTPGRAPWGLLRVVRRLLPPASGPFVVRAQRRRWGCRDRGQDQAHRRLAGKSNRGCYRVWRHGIEFLASRAPWSCPRSCPWSYAL